MSAAADTLPVPTHGVGAATRLIIAASLGNALEFYEILVYGYFAVVIANAFFPVADEAVSLLVDLGSFGDFVFGAAGWRDLPRRLWRPQRPQAAR